MKVKHHASKYHTRLQRIDRRDSYALAQWYKTEEGRHRCYWFVVPL